MSNQDSDVFNMRQTARQWLQFAFNSLNDALLCFDNNCFVLDRERFIENLAFASENVSKALYNATSSYELFSNYIEDGQDIVGQDIDDQYNDGEEEE